MALADPGQPSRDTGLPPGVEVGPLGKRVAAYLIEVLVPVIVSIVLFMVLPDASGTVRGVLSIVAALVVVGWALLIWYMLAEKAAGPGMRLMRVQLVGFYDGRPIGWMRVLLRTLIFWALCATGIGLLVMLVFLVLHPRKQGWHDLAVKAVVIKERVLAPAGPRAGVAQHVTPSPAQLPGRYAPHPTYGPVTSYSPVPTGPTSPGPQPVGAPPSSDPQRQGPQPLAPPSGIGYPTPVNQPNVPVLPEQPAAVPGTPFSPPRREQQWAAESRPMSAPSAPPVGEPEPENLDWHAVLDDGRRLVVEHLVLLGRNPQPAPGEEDAELIKIADETRTVSKLHLALGVDEAGLYVVDRGSTNGSTVTTRGGATRRCVPGETVYVNAGSIVSMGDHWLEIRRGNG